MTVMRPAACPLRTTRLLRRGVNFRRGNSRILHMALRARAHSSVLSLGVTPHEIWCRRSQDRNNPMTMGAQVRTRRFGVYLQPAQLRANLEYGVDPAIEADGARHASFDRRRVSLRWLSGTLLTGLFGAALIGSAIYAALGHQTYFAEAPAPSLSQRKEINLDFGVNPHKGDRLVKAVDIVAGKQSFQAPTTLTLGDKEVVKVHTFTHVRTTLALASIGPAEDVPPFNPLKVLADARNPIDAVQEPVQDDSEISWSTRDLGNGGFSPSAALSMEEVQAQVAEQVKNTLAAGATPLPLPPQLLLMRTSRANLPGVLAYANPASPITTSPFSTIEVRMVPENVTYFGRSPQVAQPTQMEERLVVVLHGQTIEGVLRGAGLTKDQVIGIVGAFGVARGEAAVAEGARLKLLFADLDGSGAHMTLAGLSVYSGETLETNIVLNTRR